MGEPPSSFLGGLAALAASSERLRPSWQNVVLALEQRDAPPRKRRVRAGHENESLRTGPRVLGNDRGRAHRGRPRAEPLHAHREAALALETDTTALEGVRRIATRKVSGPRVGPQPSDLGLLVTRE